MIYGRLVIRQKCKEKGIKRLSALHELLPDEKYSRLYPYWRGKVKKVDLDLLYEIGEAIGVEWHQLWKIKSQKQLWGNLNEHP